MKKLLVTVVVACFVAAPAWGAKEAQEEAKEQKEAKEKVYEGPARDASNEIKIRKIYDDFQAAWNRHDVAAMAGMYTLDADHVEPDGRVAKGRPAIEKLFDMEHQTVFKKTTLALSLESVWFITSDVALVDGTYQLADAVDPKGNPLEPIHGRLTAVILQERGGWWIAASRLMRPVPLEWRADD